MSTVRARNPRGQGEKLREDLLEAANELMVEHGTIEAVGLRAIAGRAGVSPTAVYRHFESHEALVREAMDICWHRFGDHLTNAMAGVTDPHERLRLMGNAYVEFAETAAGTYRVLFSNPHDSDMAKSVLDLLVVAVREVLAANDDPRDAYFVAVQVQTWTHGIVDLVGCHPGLDWPATEHLMSELGVRLELTPKR